MINHILGYLWRKHYVVRKNWSLRGLEHLHAEHQKRATRVNRWKAGLCWDSWGRNLWNKRRIWNNNKWQTNIEGKDKETGGLKRLIIHIHLDFIVFRTNYTSKHLLFLHHHLLHQFHIWKIWNLLWRTKWKDQSPFLRASTGLKGLQVLQAFFLIQ